MHIYCCVWILRGWLVGTVRYDTLYVGLMQRIMDEQKKKKKKKKRRGEREVSLRTRAAHHKRAGKRQQTKSRQLFFYDMTSS